MRPKGVSKDAKTSPSRALKTGVLCRECDQKVSRKTPKRPPKTAVLCRECDQKPRKSSKMLNVRSPPWYLAWKSQKKRSERRKKRARIPSVNAQKTDFAIGFGGHVPSVRNLVFHTGTIAPAQKYFCIFRVSKNVVFRVSH